MDWQTKVWTFLNSPVGLMVLGSVLLPFMTLLMKYLLQKSPTMAQIYLTYKGPLFDAVKWVEEQVPDDVADSGLRKLDGALKYLLALKPELEKFDRDLLKGLLSQAHAEVMKEPPAAPTQTTNTVVITPTTTDDKKGSDS